MPSRALCLCLCVCLATVLAIPVSAQGQSPTSPRPRPRAGDLGGVGGGLGAGGVGGTLGGAPVSAGTRERDRLGADRSGGREGVRAGRETGLDRLEGERDDAGPGAEGERAGGRARAEAAGAPASVVTGGAGDAGGTEMRVGASTINVTGGAEGFEPTLMRKPDYPQLPEVGEPITALGPMSLTEFLDLINAATGWDIISTAAAKEAQLPYFTIENKPPALAMNILRANDIYYTYDEETNYLVVMPIAEYLEKEFGDVVEEEFIIQNADTLYMEAALSALLSAKGRIVTDTRTNRIYVWDTPDNIEAMQEAVEELDVPLRQELFNVAYADIGDIEGVLSTILGETGSLLTDARTGQIMVWDSPGKLARMREAVERLDVPIQSRTFEIAHINAEDTIDALEVLLSARGQIQVDPRYNTLVVSDLPERVDRISEVLDTLDRELETRTWVLDYADIEFIADQIEAVIPAEMGEIVLNEDVHQITATGLPSRLDRIDELVQTWDVKRRQVLIEAFIVEVNSALEREFNVRWSYFGEDGLRPIRADIGGGFQPDANAPLTLGQLPYNVPLYGALELENGNIQRPIVTNIAGENVIQEVAGNNLAFTLDYLDRNDQATILSSPRVTVQDGEEATFENATRVPFVSATTFFGFDDRDGGQDNFRPRNTNRIEFIDVGTILSVFPRITEEQSILLDISAEDSTFVDKVIVANDQQSTVPQKTVRRASTQLRVHTGETVVLGGLRRDRAADRMTKTPFLGDLPVVGRLFRYPNKQSDKNSLLIFITTTIVDEFTHPETQELAEASAYIIDKYRHNKKDFWGRLQDQLSQGNNEIGVSIGQNGEMYSMGRLVTLDELLLVFFNPDLPSSVEVVLRQHPRAPEEAVTAVTELALEAGLHIEFMDVVPVVPRYADPQDVAEDVVLMPRVERPGVHDE